MKKLLIPTSLTRRCTSKTRNLVNNPSSNCFRAPRVGHTVEGLYVCQVGRVHPSDPKKSTKRPPYNLTYPDMSEVEPVIVGPWNRFETTYKLHYPAGLAPIEKRYTPTTHKAPLPVGAQSPPSLEVLNPLLANPFLPANNSRDWNKISEKS
ncbi:unnamed protein product [Clavelina lepadiformis]|uniref:Uncharacterized protein n=1 Tax=Clavelina lepadiformis TaxID=159417 RepID=A0ABP0EZ36_CLALP